MTRGAEILTYADVANIAPGENGESLEVVPETVHGLIVPPITVERAKYCGTRHCLRGEVLRRLSHAARELQSKQPDLQLLLLSSYRAPEYQAKWHEEIKEELKGHFPQLNSTEVTHLANQRVAAPEVAGHTCGAAVDLTILGPDGELDMGCDYLDFTDPEVFRVFSEKISPKARQHRLLLREVLLNQEFAPFNGEWWHFSYGDREWAAYYEKSSSLYSPILLEDSYGNPSFQKASTLH